MIVILAACASGAASPNPTASATSTASQSQTAEPTPTATPTAPVPTVAATEGAFPPTIGNMPVMSVAAADAALAAGRLDGQFAAVGGYWMQYALPCMFPVHQGIVDGYCNGGKFADSPEDVNNPQGGIPFGSAPVSVPETVNAGLLWSAGGSGPSPFPVVVIVHAGDSRAWQCVPDQPADCQRHIVIDDVAWVNGTATNLTTNAENGVQPTMTADQVAAVAVESGQQLVTAYALPATHLNDVDPRLLGKGSGVVWLVRTAAVDASGDGIVRLISDADGSVIEELPLKVAADYKPARLVLDSQFSNNSAATLPQFELLNGTTVLADGVLNIGTPPIAVEAGAYVLHAYVSGAPQPSGASCDLPITIAAGANVAYKATFKNSTFCWAPFDPAAPF